MNIQKVEFFSKIKLFINLFAGVFLIALFKGK